MKKNSEIAEHIKALRGNASQTRFAEDLGVSQAAVSAWELGDRAPSSELWMKLGNRARYPDNIWCWQQAGLDLGTMLSIAGQILKERGAPAKDQVEVWRIRRYRLTADGKEEDGPRLLVPAEIISNPASTASLVLDEQSASFMFTAGDLAIVDRSYADAQDLRPLFDKAVLMEFTKDDPQWRKGLRIGRLVFYQRDAFQWNIDLRPLDTRAGGHRLVVGWCRFGPDFGKGARSIPEQQMLAEKAAPQTIRLSEGCRTAGEVIGWLRNPDIKSDD